MWSGLSLCEIRSCRAIALGTTFLPVIETPIHVIDFEGSRQSGIVEYGVVTLVGANIVSTQTRLCAPIGTISDRDRLQHGISEEAAGAEARFDAEWSLFAELRETGPLCAHNAAVEDGLLRTVWPYPRNSPNFAEEWQTTATWGPWLDTLYLYRRIYPQLVSHKLGDLIALFDLQAALDEQAKLYCPVKRQRYHCALYDTLASALLLRRLYEEPDLKAMTLRWLFLQSSSTDAARDSMGQQDLF
jgi:DNA polymerase-3 subunit epsilon